MLWQKKIINGFIYLFFRIEKELGLSIEDLSNLLLEEKIIDSYNSYQKEKLSRLYSDQKTIFEEELDNDFLTFLRTNFSKYTNNTNFEFLLNPEEVRLSEAIYDPKIEKYIIVLNSAIYNTSNFNKIKKTKTSNPLFFNKTNYNDEIIATINYKDLITSGLIIAASTIHHNLNFLGFTLSNYKFYKYSASNDLLIFLARLISFQLDLEIIMQTNNPLEVASFFQQLDKFEDNQKHWSKLINQIEQTYNEESLKKYHKLYSQKANSMASRRS